MESASWLTSAGVIAPVIGGAGLKGGKVGAAWGGAGEAAALFCFFWQAIEGPGSRAKDRIASRPTEIFSMVNLAGSNLSARLAQVSAPASNEKKSTTQARNLARHFTLWHTNYRNYPTRTTPWSRTSMQRRWKSITINITRLTSPT